MASRRRAWGRKAWGPCTVGAKQPSRGRQGFCLQWWSGVGGGTGGEVTPWQFCSGLSRDMENYPPIPAEKTSVKSGKSLFKFHSGI